MESMVKVSGTDEVWAEDTGGAGTPLVLLHPGVGDSSLWDGILPGLAARHRVIRYDVRGYGRSPAPTARYSIAADLAAVLDHFGARRAVLVGSSMGGSAALSLAVADPGRVAGLALFVPGVTGYEGLEPAGFVQELERLATAGDTEGIVALGLGIWGRAGTDGDPHAAAALRSALRGWFTNHPHQVPDAPVFDRLGEVAAPTVLALGELDQPEVVRCNEEMAARIPGCRLVRLAGSDHFPTLREPEAVAGLIEDLAARVG
ncbi:alpha/beta fold hydrolase [Streptomyces sp. NPDC101118]|uniref:alpha/beta fold hydrolase n=1 Tax=Streptomyces sp. NPDC101118 TaxID=3366109 RepID=UPI003809445D